VASRTFPDGETVTYTFDEAGWLASIPGYITAITYDARGQQTHVQYANGVASTWNYHATNFRVINRSTSGASEVLQNLTYTYDPGGNITQITDGVFTGGRTFTYDALNRLAEASGTFGTGQAYVTETYRYDAIGGLLERAGVLYTYSDPLHPSAVTSRTDGSAYAYDANGNMQNGAGRVLAWDADHRLSAVTIQGGSSATFAYDPAGVRVRKTTSAGVTRYPFAGYEIDPSGVVTKYLGGVAKKSTGAVLFYHNDHLGGLNVITDLSGARVQLVEYDPWGQVSRAEGDADPTHRFTGKELDPETGLYYYGGRYYDPILATFVGADPFVPAPGNPQSLNRYSYVLNSPVNLVDPSGFFFKKLWRSIRKWARGNEFLSVVAGVHLMTLPSPAANLAGLSMVTATETGRTAIAASIVIGTAVATWYCGGCGAAVGALVGELLGAYSAYQSGGDIVMGVVVGGAVGAATGYLGQYMAAAVPDGGWSLNIGRWAVEGGGQGIAVGFAGGRGDFRSIVLASAIASTTAVLLNSAYYGMAEYDATLQPGGAAVRKESTLTMPVKGANNVGFADPMPGSCFWCEGAPLSGGLSRVPGINATAGFHDALLVKIELAGVSAAGRTFLNIPMMIPSAALTFGALVPGVPATAAVDR
jgi:RHS repeat-associated protein